MKNLYIAVVFCTITQIISAQISLVKQCQLVNGWPYMSVANGKLFFAADDTTHGLELWVSDGTTSGTHMVKDINPGVDGGVFFGNTFEQEKSRIVYNNEFYFLAYENTHGIEIWKSDGTESGTQLLKDINPSGNVTGSNNNDYPFFCIASGQLFFQAYDGGAHGAELWKTDGTATGTVLVKDIYPGYPSSSPKNLVAYHSEILFRAWGLNTGEELWKSDGTDAGTVMVKDIRQGPYSCFFDNSSWIDPLFRSSGNYVFFRANIDSPQAQFHLWRTDGTEAGTIQLENNLTLLEQTEEDNADVNGIFYFLADDNTPSNLWKSDGTAGGTVNVSAGNSLAANSDFFNFNGILEFDGNDNTGYGLCRSNGTAAGTYLVKSFPSLASTASVRGFATDGNFLYFGVLSAVNASSMEWRVGQSNGTTSGTVRISHYGFVGGLIPFNGKIYYGGYDTIINSSYVGLGLYELTPLNVGVSEISEGANFSVYPNPSSSTIEVVIPNTARNLNVVIQVLDLTGRKVFLKKVAASEDKISIDVSDLTEGMYLLKIDEENFQLTEKISVMH